MRDSKLIPRYKVINKYPHSPHTIGDIVVGEMFSDSIFKLFIYHDDFPNIFRKLKWWEERTLETLPKHLKFIGPEQSGNDNLEIGKTYEVIRWTHDELLDIWYPFIIFKDNREDIENFEPIF